MVTAKQKKEREDWWLRAAQAVVVVFVLAGLVWFFTIGSQISQLSGKIGQLEALVGTKLDALTSAVERSTAAPAKAGEKSEPPIDRTELDKLESGVTSQISQLTTRAAQLETLVTVKLEDLTKAIEKSESKVAQALDRPPQPDPRVDAAQAAINTVQTALAAAQDELGTLRKDLGAAREQAQAAARETDSLRQDLLAATHPTSPPSLEPLGHDAKPTDTTNKNNTDKTAASWLIAVAPITRPDGTLTLPVHLIDAETGIIYTWQLAGNARDEKLLMARLWGMAKGCDPTARPLDFLAESNGQASPVNRLWLPGSFALNIRAQDVPIRVYREFFGSEPTPRATNKTVTTPDQLISFLKIYPRLLTAERIGRVSYQR